MVENQLKILARSFPTLRSAPGIAPWDPTALDTWAAGPAPSTAAVHAAQFILALWDHQRPWRCGRFDLLAAAHTWDDAHLGALRTWLTKPWSA